MPRYATRQRAAEPHPITHQAITHQAITLAGLTWLASGAVLLGLTPLPAHAASWGWSPLFWLLLAPAILLAARRWLQAATPLRLASMRRKSSSMILR